MSASAPGRWDHLSPYLDQALTLTDPERAEWLAALREKDPALADELQALLEEHRAIVDERFLEQGPVAVPALAKAGQRIGAYTLISPIGQGGMGSIWLAERSDGRFERRAAVKFLNLTLLGRGGEERFKREGSILGRVAHPHIAELLDAGLSAEGQPYLILEHVEGQHIDQYCDGQRLGVEARVALFLDVLDAVAHAHANLIVHRDLKPSNVLVRNDGQVKLLDFGIAKLLEEEGEAGASTQLTLQAGGALTPAYAAPEQITSKPVTTATDVYALGVLLYLLLTGQHPAGAGPHSAADLLKAILETAPPRLSEAAASSDVNAIAQKRCTTPDRLQRQLRGDLDTILSKTLKKNPAERYSSVAALKDDLQRYLNHEPIGARPDTVAYRAAKFVGRNRTASIVMAATVLVVIASLSTGLYIANRQRAIAEQRFVQVRQLANKFIAMDEALRGLPGSTKIRSRLVADALQYLTSLGNEVHGDKDLALEIAYAYVRVAHAQGDPTSPNLGRYAEAEASLHNASKFVEPILTSDPTNERALFIACTIAHDQMELGVTLGRSAERIVADADKSAALLERYTRLPKIDVYSTVYFYTNTAGTYMDYRSFDQAMRYWQRALDLSRADTKAQRLHGSILYGMAIARWQAGELDAALKTIQQAVPLDEKEAATGHASLRINLAYAYQVEGDILGQKDALPSFLRTRDALALVEKGHKIVEELAERDSGDNRSRQASELMSTDIGNMLRREDPRHASAAYDHALARLHEMSASPERQKDEATLLATSAYALRWLGQRDEARHRIDSAFQILRELHEYPANGMEPMAEVYNVLRSLADDYLENGETSKAVATYQELLAGLTAWKLRPDADLRDATCLSRTWTALAELLRSQGKTAEAARFEQQRSELWARWKAKVPNAEFLLRQSLEQAYRLPRASRRPIQRPQENLK